MGSALTSHSGLIHNYPQYTACNWEGKAIHAFEKPETRNQKPETRNQNAQAVTPVITKHTYDTTGKRRCAEFALTSFPTKAIEA